MLFKRFLQFCILFLLPGVIWAQVTTSNITGTVTQVNGKTALDGASITAVHTPTGTEYKAIANKDGIFELPGLKVGGPYTVTVQYAGLQTQKYQDIYLQLGQTYELNALLNDKSSSLETVVVKSSRFKPNIKTGASTVINATTMRELPTINRTLSDYTRLTPQANGNGFAGRDGRYNNLQVDGVNLNNNFGLSTDPTPGGGASPISVDALDQISINIAPYDVRQSGFTGAGLNVVTKSGTNDFHGTFYSYFRNQNMNGYNVNGNKINKTPNNNKIFGGSIGGPIIKNKLFFFVNGEFEKGSTPGITFTANGSSINGNPSTTKLSDLQKVSDFVKSTYGYDLGAYDNFPNFTPKNHKVLGRIDWNISDKHKLTAKYTDFKSTDYSVLNGSSIPNNGTINVTGPTGKELSYTRLPNNRFSANSMAFNNSNYYTDHKVKTASLELNSRFNNKISNQFLATYMYSDDKRGAPGGIFPTVDIFDGQGQNYISLGTDPFTNNNDVYNKVLDITDNFTYYAGRHTITAGATYEHQKVGNMFMGGSNSHYVFNSLDDFLEQKAPVYYGLTYSVVPGQSAVYSADLGLNQAGLYIQDEYKINNNFKLTAGVRADMPIYGSNPIENPAINALSFPDKNGNMINYNSGKWPKNRVMLSPRIGFNWDVMGDKSFVVRGGTGMFVGRIPLVFLTNMPSNNGMYQASVNVNNATQMAKDGITKFDPNPTAYQSAFPSTAAGTVPSSFVVIDPNFKFPKVWRSNLGIDKSLGDGFTGTIDFLYTKDINAVSMRNINLKGTNGNFTGDDNRGYYADKSTASMYYYPTSTVGTPIALENNSKGHSFSATAQVSKTFASGFYGSLAYTYTEAKEVSPNPGSRATSAWQSIYNVEGPNANVVANSQYAIPHRIVANLGYKISYAKFMTSTISFFYQGSAQSRFNYTASIIGDGNQELMYVYKSGADVPFVAKKGYTIEEQQQAYDQFVNSSSYLKKNKGKYVSRYGALAPWFNELDMRFLQDFYISTAGGTKHDLQLSVDIFNLPNLLSSKWANWGYQKMYTVSSPLVMAGVVDNHPTYTMNTYSSALANNAFTVNQSSSSTWRMQLGIRYSF